MESCRRLPLLPALACALLAPAFMPRATADIVHLKSGARLEGKVTETPDGVVVESADGSRLTVPRAQVLKIEKRRTPQDEYAARAAGLTPGDTQGWLDLGFWCRNNGLYREASAAFQKVLDLNPEHAEARQALGYQRVGDAWIKGAWAQLESEHFLLSYTTPVPSAQSASHGLENFHAAFLRAFCPPLTIHGVRKIPIVLFHRRVDYLEHVQETFPHIAGKAERLEQIPRAFTENATRKIVGYIEAGEDESLLLTVLFHETTHALVQMTLDKPVRTPRWFEEAFADYLACSTVGNGEIFVGQGVGEHFLYRGRLAETRWAVKQGKFLPLRELLAKNEFDFTDERVGVMYSQSLTLLYHLLTRESSARPGAFREYLVAVTQGKGWLDDFERIFGVKADELEKRWLQAFKE